MKEFSVANDLGISNQTTWDTILIRKVICGIVTETLWMCNESTNDRCADFSEFDWKLHNSHSSYEMLFDAGLGNVKKICKKLFYCSSSKYVLINLAWFSIIKILLTNVFFSRFHKKISFCIFSNPDVKQQLQIQFFHHFPISSVLKQNRISIKTQNLSWFQFSVHELLLVNAWPQKYVTTLISPAIAWHISNFRLRAL